MDDLCCSSPVSLVPTETEKEKTLRNCRESISETIDAIDHITKVARQNYKIDDDELVDLLDKSGLARNELIKIMKILS